MAKTFCYDQKRLDTVSLNAALQAAAMFLVLLLLAIVLPLAKPSSMTVRLATAAPLAACVCGLLVCDILVVIGNWAELKRFCESRFGN